jgi:predicted alpha/beta superfamily hydrolase
VVDNFLEPARAALFGAGLLNTTPEMIVVAVGSPAATSVAEFQRRRTYDFIPAKGLMGPDFAGLPEDAMGGAPGFRDFLVNQLRPLLAREYRMDPNDHAIAGHSGGAQFALYVLFNQPESFSRYLVSSPAASRPWLDMEEKWFREHKDLKARVFLSAGEAEANHPLWAAAQIVSTVALMSERLTSRKYPSLSLDVRIFPGEDHLTVIPVAYAHGIRYLWRK